MNEEDLSKRMRSPPNQAQSSSAPSEDVDAWLADEEDEEVSRKIVGGQMRRRNSGGEEWLGPMEHGGVSVLEERVVGMRMATEFGTQLLGNQVAELGPGQELGKGCPAL